MVITKYIIYDPEDNSFRDTQSYLVDIYRYLTPNDVLLFKKNHKNNVFSCKDEPRMTIEILVKGENGLDTKQPKPIQDFSKGKPEIRKVLVQMLIHVDNCGLTFDRVLESYGDYTLNELAERFYVSGHVSIPDKVETHVVKRRVRKEDKPASKKEKKK